MTSKIATVGIGRIRYAMTNAYFVQETVSEMAAVVVTAPASRISGVTLGTTP